ncbi:DUF1501 domain-containing protein [Caulobacter segnis]|uniref:DUF1501 domain-containing protein n=1 Tax=Caulobacter segnis TaxID=88688 RepID=UPI00241084AE|nr:DUF1501 domain-containing protein [Caulobacter segnis]MDG2521729.1 DUF1501 domain-containing protein [Caulobacter segnis]
MTDHHTHGFSRRQALFGALGLGASVTFMGRAARAEPNGKKLIVLVCRGGLDGLSLTPPVGDADYAGLRGGVAYTPEQALKLDGTFGLHPAMSRAHALAQKGQLRIAPAVATPDRARSHFEAQDVLETGSEAKYTATSGWLNRTLQALSPERKVEALSVGAVAPLILRGQVQAASWSPGRNADSTARLPTILQDLYKNDPLLGPVFARGLQTEAMAQIAMTGLPAPATAQPMEGMAKPDPAAMQAAQRQGMAAAEKLGVTVANFMTQAGGPQIVAISLDGFDTHSGQVGQLQQRLNYMDALIGGLTTGLGPAWKDTVIVAATEFGRTARVNGTGGTDHGTASSALVLGGGLKKGGIIGDWPTLQQTALFENRDTRPTLDMRGLFKGVLRDHLGVEQRALDTTVFPDSASARPVTGIV